MGALAADSVAQPDLDRLPPTSLLRFYDPSTQGNSFSLDGFPTLKEGKRWQTRLREFIHLQGTLGMTTNQTLFRQLLETGILDSRLRAFKSEGRSASEIYQILYNEAATEAARIFAPVNARWPWEGRVSQEASALLTELDPLVREVQRIAEAMQAVPAFTKVPNLRVGPQAVRQAAATGQVNPNVTLLFSDQHYLDTAEGYLLGLKDLADRLKGQGRPENEIRETLSRIHSVNSLFVSRVDRIADPMIEETLGTVQPGDTFGDSPRRDTLRCRVSRPWAVPFLRSPSGLSPILKGKIAVAQAKKVYQIFEAIFLGKPFPDPEGLYADEEGSKMLRKIDALRSLFGSLRPLGANRQRLLIASSGVKSDQPYSPLLYVLPFLGPWCANTLPEGTLEAFSRWTAERSDDQIAALRKRSIMAEPLPAVPTDVQPRDEWDRVLLLDPAQRRSEGIADWTPDRILREAHRLVFQPNGTTLRAICDTLRDKGADSFTADEKATLQALETKLSAA